jgi:hypothetical protein
MDECKLREVFEMRVILKMKKVLCNRTPVENKILALDEG